MHLQKRHSVNSEIDVNSDVNVNNYNTRLKIGSNFNKLNLSREGFNLVMSCSIFGLTNHLHWQIHSKQKILPLGFHTGSPFRKVPFVLRNDANDSKLIYSCVIFTLSRCFWQLWFFSNNSWKCLIKYLNTIK